MADEHLIRGWERLQRQFDPERLKKRIAVMLPIAHEQAGKRFVAIATEKIDGRAYEPNAALTVALKGSDLPLVGSDGHLREAITYKVRGARRVEFGSKSPKLPSGRALYDVLHEGVTIKVTPKMRAAVMAKLNEDRQRIMGLKRKSKQRKAQLAWIDEAHKALAEFKGSASAYWVIPPRPYLREVWQDEAWRSFAKRTYHEALVEILRAPPAGGQGA